MSLEKAIRKTVEYAAKFESNINRKEIGQRLISKKVFLKKEIEDGINKIEIKNKKNKWKYIKFKKAKDLADLIGVRFKDILFLGISGSVASGHPKKNDDIDILIITKADTLWKNRLGLRWWIYKNKIPHRGFNKKEVADQFCFNLWLDERSLTLPQNKQNLKNAVDLILLKPLINKNKTYEKFMGQNSWAKNFVAVGYTRKKKEKLKIKKNNFWNEITNWIWFWPQYVYMRRKIDQEKVDLHRAFFHR